MSINYNEDTEFNDALRKHGIIPQRETTPPTPSPPGSPNLKDRLDELEDDELKALEEEVNNDEMERTIEAYRRQRAAEERREQKRARFGSVIPINRDEYTREVTEASKVSEEGDAEENGTGVTCFLYKDGIPRSDRTFGHVRALAAKYPRSKFVAIVGNKCIENLPDSRIPMFIIYRRGEIRNQLLSWGSDKERTMEELETLLIMCDAIDIPDRPPAGQNKDDSDLEDEEEEDRDRDASSRMRSAATSTNGRTAKNVRASVQDGSDSEFEFDM